MSSPGSAVLWMIHACSQLIYSPAHLSKGTCAAMQGLRGFLAIGCAVTAEAIIPMRCGMGSIKPS